MTCDKSAHVHAYYDNELSPAQRGDFESHLQECADCRGLLAELRQVSSLLTAAPMGADLSQMAMARLRNTWQSARDRGVMRMAGWLTAAAAAVLIGALLVWPGGRGDEGLRASAGAGGWPAAVMPPAEAHDGDIASADLVGVAQWMANDLSSDQR
jgi:anti-sigma factor RsiW